MRRHLLALALFLPVVACSADAGEPDAAPDAELRPVPGGEVLGSWRELPPAAGTNLRVFTFFDDGRYEILDGAPPAAEGTYTVGDGRLVLTDAGNNVTDTAYYADDERLLLALLEPDDDGADPIATWTSQRQTPSGVLSVVIVLGADGTAHTERTDDNGTEVLDGTWVLADGAIELSLGASTEAYWLYAGFLGRGYERI